MSIFKDAKQGYFDLMALVKGDLKINTIKEDVVLSRKIAQKKGKNLVKVKNENSKNLFISIFESAKQGIKDIKRINEERKRRVLLEMKDINSKRFKEAYRKASLELEYNGTPLPNYITDVLYKVESQPKPQPKEVVEVKKIENKSDVDGALEESVIKALGVVGINVKEFSKVIAGYRNDFLFFHVDGKDIETFLSIKSKRSIVYYLNRNLKPISKDGDFEARSVTIIDSSSYYGYGIMIEKETQTPMYSDNYFNMTRRDTLEFVVEIQGVPKTVDMAKAPHPLICGTTGSGKSTLMISMLKFFENNCSVNSLSMSLVSPKLEEGGDLRPFSNSKHLTRPLIIQVGISLEEFLNSVEDALIEATEIMLETEKNVLNGINPTKYHLVVIDEINSILVSNIGESDEVSDARNRIRVLMSTILERGRSSRVHLLLATQSPRSDILKSIKSNVNIISLKVSNKIESKLVGVLNADEFLGSGDGFINIGKVKGRFQSAI